MSVCPDLKRRPTHQTVTFREVRHAKDSTDRGGQCTGGVRAYIWAEIPNWAAIVKASGASLD
jgi:hypothetical protein